MSLDYDELGIGKFRNIENELRQHSKQIDAIKQMLEKHDKQIALLEQIVSALENQIDDGR